MKFVEKVLIVLSVISLMLIFSQLDGSAALAMLSLTLLALFYFLPGILFFSGIGLREAFKGALKNIKIVTLVSSFFIGNALSIFCIGMLFRLLHFPGANEMLMAGFIPATAMLVIMLLKFFKDRSQQSRLALSRLVPFMILAFVLFFTSSRTLLGLQYRNHPEYVNAFMRYQENPSPETERERDREYRRMTLSPADFERYEKSMY
jgi:hypothetical protein